MDVRATEMNNDDDITHDPLRVYIATGINIAEIERTCFYPC
jgi:hypothetical protein